MLGCGFERLGESVGAKKSSSSALDASLNGIAGVLTGSREAALGSLSASVAGSDVADVSVSSTVRCALAVCASYETVALT